MEFQKYLSLIDTKKVMSMEDKFKQIEKKNNEFINILDRKLKELKDDTLRKVVKEVENYKKNWESEYNKEINSGHAKNRLTLSYLAGLT